MGGVVRFFLAVKMKGMFDLIGEGLIGRVAAILVLMNVTRSAPLR